MAMDMVIYMVNETDMTQNVITYIVMSEKYLLFYALFALIKVL